MDYGTISIYLDEINLHHKIKIRDDSRVESVIFFEEHMTLIALLKGKKNESSNPEEKRDKFKKIKSLEQIHLDFQPHEYLALSIFDKVKVKVETTTEFPLDIQCTLLFTKEDQEEYDKIKRQAEEKAQKQREEAEAAARIG